MEYFKEDLILVLIKTISDLEHVDVVTNGFRKDVIPEAKDAIRIDLVGGFVLQKVNRDRCYFRATFDFDIKLDIIPPSLINFISRQLIGNGHKLYQKAVGSVAASDEEYRKALEGPLYVLIRQRLYTSSVAGTTLESDKSKSEAPVKGDDKSKSEAPVNIDVIKTSSATEITEEDFEPKSCCDGSRNLSGSPRNQAFDENWPTSIDRNSLSPEVEHALCILDQAISIFKANGIHRKNDSKSSPVGEIFPVSGLYHENATECGNKPNLRNISRCCPPTEGHRQTNTFSLEEAGDYGISSRPEDGNLGSGNSGLVESRSHFHKKLSTQSIKLSDAKSMTTNGFFSSSQPFSDNCKKASGEGSVASDEA